MTSFLDIGLKMALGAASLILQDPTAELRQAQQSELKKEFRSALGIYRKFTRDASLGEEATLGELRCLTGLKDWPGLHHRADALLKDVRAKKPGSLRLLVAAYTAAGDVDDGAGRPKEALFNYLRGLAAVPEGETCPEHELALARCSLACSRIATAAPDRSTKATYRHRAGEVLEELQKKYPGSRLQADVEKGLREIR